MDQIVVWHADGSVSVYRNGALFLHADATAAQIAVASLPPAPDVQPEGEQS